MAIEAKALLLRGIERELSTEITAMDLRKVLSIVSHQLACFDVVQLKQAICENDDLLSAFIIAMEIEGRSENTIKRYRYIIMRMMRTINVGTRDITVYHLRQYLAQEMARGIADSTLEGTRQIFSAYFNWLQRESLIDTNPTANLGAIKCTKKVKETYSDIDIERLKQNCSSVRDRAIIAFLSSTGCRISEMTKLNRDDVDLSKLECIVMGKGSKERTVYLNSVCGMLLKEYLGQRTDDSNALFVGKGSDRLSPQGVRVMLKKLAAKSNVGHVHPHKFRRTLATTLIRHGMPIQEVAAILGHDRLDTTMEYVVLDSTEIKHSYRKYA